MLTDKRVGEFAYLKYVNSMLEQNKLIHPVWILSMNISSSRRVNDKFSPPKHPLNYYWLLTFRELVVESAFA